MDGGTFFHGYDQEGYEIWGSNPKDALLYSEEGANQKKGSLVWSCIDQILIYPLKKSKLDRLQALQNEGILRELCPRSSHWHYEVLQPNRLPAEFHQEFEELGEIRHYWG